MKKSAYQVLGVSPDAPQEVIDACYKALVAKFSHEFKDDHESYFRHLKDCSDAHTILSDFEKRAAHDFEIEHRQSEDSNSSFETPYSPASTRLESSRKQSTHWLLIFLVFLILFGVGSFFRNEIVNLVTSLDESTKSENQVIYNLSPSLAEKLTLEPCDSQIHRKVIKYLRKADQSRALADLTWKWSAECKLDKSKVSSYLLEATTNYRSIGETGKAKLAAERLVERLPQSGQARMQLAANLMNLDQYEEAAEQYTWVFQLIRPSSIAYSIYHQAINSLEQLGRGCEAIDLYRLMLRQRNPGNSEDVEARIDILQNKFICGSSTSEPIRIATKNGKVSFIKVSINGVEGEFVFDTGASITSVSLDFANKSGLKLNPKMKVKIQTANGSSYAFNSHSRKIQVENVDMGSGQIIVLQNRGSLGKYDGLLGMNIISRFDIEKTTNEWVLKSKY